MKNTRLEMGIALRKGVLAAGGSDRDVALVMEKRLSFFAEAGRQLVETAQVIRGDEDCFRFTDEELIIEIPALKRPKCRELHKELEGIITRIVRDDSTEAAVTMRLGTVRKSTEVFINSTTYKERILKFRAEGKLLGFQHRRWFFKNVDLLPEPAKSAVKALLGKVYIDFTGIVVTDKRGYCYVPCAYGVSGERWCNTWSSIDDGGFDSYGRIAVSSK